LNQQAVMTRIDFHSNVPDKLAYACRLVRKARAQNLRVVMMAADAAQLQRLDEMLWTFSDLDFLPHVAIDSPLAAQTPILLMDMGSEDADLPHHQVLVNLAQQSPGNFARFERMFEIVSAEEEDRLAGRDRYRHYHQRGYPLTHYDAEKA
jgi:DNA polymerase-3 subunit chi